MVSQLTPEEREKFAEYCRHEAETASQLAEQATEGGPEDGGPIGRHQRLKAVSFAVVAQDLINVEDRE